MGYRRISGREAQKIINNGPKQCICQMASISGFSRETEPIRVGVCVCVCVSLPPPNQVPSAKGNHLSLVAVLGLIAVASLVVEHRL